MWDLTQGKTMPTKIALRLAHKLIQNVASLNRRGVIHHDIKPENILSGSSMNLWICDYGIACDATKYCTQFEAGTPGYMAPEVFQYSRGQLSFDNNKVDVFSTGVTLIWMLSGANPFYIYGISTLDMETYRLLKRDDFYGFWKRAATVPQNQKPDFCDEFKSLVWEMLKYDPKERITIEKANNKSFDWHNQATYDEVKNYWIQRLEEFKREKALDETLEKQREEAQRRMNRN